MPEAGPPGRRRSTDAAQAVLETTLELLEERPGGYRELTMQAVAHRSGVSKSTLYRWWPNKAHLVLDAVRSRARRDVTQSPTGNLGFDLTSYLSRLADTLSQPKPGRGIAEITAAAASDHAFRALYQRTILRERRGDIIAIVTASHRSGRLRAGVDPEVVADIVLGALHHRLLLTRAPINREFVKSLSLIILTGVTTGHIPD